MSSQSGAQNTSGDSTDLQVSLSAFYKLKNIPVPTPSVHGQHVNLWKLFTTCKQLGGYQVCQWDLLAQQLLKKPELGNELKAVYEAHLIEFEQFVAEGKDLVTEFYQQHKIFKLKSHKPFDGHFIQDRMGILPLKELNEFLKARSYGFNHMMQDRLTNMQRSLHDNAKVAIMADLGMVDMLGIIKMLESNIFDEKREGLQIINLCSLEFQIDMYWVENPELYKALMFSFKREIELLNNGVEGSLRLVNMHIMTFCNIVQRKELRKWVREFDTVEQVCRVTSGLIKYLAGNIPYTPLFIDLEAKAKPLMASVPYSRSLLDSIIPILFHASVFFSNCCCDVVLSSHRQSSLFHLLSFTQLKVFDEYLVDQSTKFIDLCVHRTTLVEIHKNIIFTIGNLLIMAENHQTFVSLLVKCRKVDHLSLLLQQMSSSFPIDDTPCFNDESFLTDRYFELHVLYRIIAKEVLSVLEHCPNPAFNCTKFVRQMIAVITQPCTHPGYQTMQGKAIFTLSRIAGWAVLRIKLSDPELSPKSLQKKLNPLFLDWDLAESWLMEIMSDIRVQNRQRLTTLLGILSRSSYQRSFE